MKRCRLEVRPVGPRKSPGLFVQANAIEEAGVAKRAEDLAAEDRAKVDYLAGPVLEPHAKRKRRDLFEIGHRVDLMRHGYLSGSILVGGWPAWSALQFSRSSSRWILAQVVTRRS